MKKLILGFALMLAFSSPVFAQGIKLPGLVGVRTTPPLAGRDFICQATNLSNQPLALNVAILDQGGDDITNGPGAPFISCEGAPLGPGVVCSMRAGSQTGQATAAYCTVSFVGAASRVRASLQAFDDGGIAAAVAAE